MIILILNINVKNKKLDVLIKRINKNKHQYK